MSYASSNPYRDFGMVADQAPTDVRAGFIRKTYMHLLGAVLAFIGIEAALFATGAAESMTDRHAGQRPRRRPVILLGIHGH